MHFERVFHVIQFLESQNGAEKGVMTDLFKFCYSKSSLLSRIQWLYLNRPVLLSLGWLDSNRVHWQRHSHPLHSFSGAKKPRKRHNWPPKKSFKGLEGSPEPRLSKNDSRNNSISHSFQPNLYNVSILGANQFGPILKKARFSKIARFSKNYFTSIPSD